MGRRESSVDLDKHGVSFPEAPRSSPTRPPSTLMTDRRRTGWSSLEPHCAIAFSMSCMSNGADATASSVHAQPLVSNETSTSPEITHDPVS
jgi:hypothetical protein